MPKQWIEDAEEIAAFLARARVGRLGLCREGQPYVVPVSFVFAEGKLYFHCGPRGRKLDCLRANPRVCFEVDELEGLRLGESACNHSLRYTSVIAQGRACLLTDPAQKERALRWLLAKYTPGDAAAPFPPPQLARVEVVEITIEEMTAKRNVES